MLLVGSSYSVVQTFLAIVHSATCRQSGRQMTDSMMTTADHTDHMTG